MKYTESEPPLLPTGASLTPKRARGSSGGFGAGAVRRRCRQVAPLGAPSAGGMSRGRSRDDPEARARLERAGRSLRHRALIPPQPSALSVCSHYVASLFTLLALSVQDIRFCCPCNQYNTPYFVRGVYFIYKESLFIVIFQIQSLINLLITFHCQYIGHTTLGLVHVRNPPYPFFLASDLNEAHSIKH